LQTTLNMTIDEYSKAHKEMISEYADKAIANYNEFPEGSKNDERLKLSIEIAMANLLLKNRILQSKPIEL